MRIFEESKIRIVVIWDPGVPLAIVAATISAAIAVKQLVSYLQNRSLSVFSWYRLALDLVIGGLILGGVFKA